MNTTTGAWIATLTQMQVTELEKLIPDVHSRLTEAPSPGPLTTYYVPLDDSESNLVIDLLGEEPIRQ